MQFYSASSRAILETLDAVQLNDIEIHKVDIDSLSAEERQRLRIQGVPILVLSRDGVEYRRLLGVASKEQLKEFLGLA